jgi:hypothetical protein
VTPEDGAQVRPGRWGFPLERPGELWLAQAVSPEGAMVVRARVITGYVRDTREKVSQAVSSSKNNGLQVWSFILIATMIR